MHRLKVWSVFYSISGEIGLWPQGLPVVFLRLANCNLSCPYCDTKESINIDRSPIHIRFFFSKIRKFNCKRILITGGEPLLQKEQLMPLLGELKKIGFEISIETNGSIPFDDIYTLVNAINVDIKCPASGLNHKMIHPDQIPRRKKVYFKFPIQTMVDLLYAKEYIEKFNLLEESRGVSISPISPTMTAAKLWDSMNELKMRDIAINTQIHKYIWPNPGGEER